MSTKHTPGPWHVFTPIEYVGPEDVPSPGIDADNGDAVVWYGRGAEQGIANDADAYLIAAAPQLLDALTAIVNSLADQDDEGLIEHAEQMIAARAAIAKATGEQA